MSNIHSSLQEGRNDLVGSSYNSKKAEIPRSVSYKQSCRCRQFVDSFEYLKFLITIYEKDLNHEKDERILMVYSFMKSHIEFVDDFPNRYFQAIDRLDKFMVFSRVGGELQLSETLEHLNRLKLIFAKYHPGWFESD